MFSEFDNGNLFLQRIENFKTKTIFKHNFEEHEKLKKVTELLDRADLQSVHLQTKQLIFQN